MKFEYEQDEAVGYIDVILTPEDVASLLDQGFCEGSFYERCFLKMRLNICVRKDD